MPEDSDDDELPDDEDMPALEGEDKPTAEGEPAKKAVSGIEEIE